MNGRRHMNTNSVGEVAPLRRLKFKRRPRVKTMAIPPLLLLSLALVHTAASAAAEFLHGVAARDRGVAGRVRLCPLLR